MKIRTFDELIDFIENNNISIEDCNKIIFASVGCIIVNSTTKDEVLFYLKQFCKEYAHKPRGERPLFLDLEDPLEEKKFWNDFIDKL
jgi:hypothetical protein